jgi:hypothetical protein
MIVHLRGEVSILISGTPETVESEYMSHAYQTIPGFWLEQGRLLTFLREESQGTPLFRTRSIFDEFHRVPPFDDDKPGGHTHFHRNRQGGGAVCTLRWFEAADVPALSTDMVVRTGVFSSAGIFE